MAPLRATVISQAPGRFGTPSRGQRRSAWVKASCAHSSARSQSPVWWIRAAVMRPHSSRKASATTVPTTPAAVTASTPTRPPRASPPLVRTEGPEGPHLKEAKAGHRVPARDLDDLVEVVALKHVEAGDLLLRLGERAVGHHGLLLPHPNGAGAAWRLKLAAVQANALAVRLLDPGVDRFNALELPRVDRRVGAHQHHVPDLALAWRGQRLDRSPLRQGAYLDRPRPGTGVPPGPPHRLVQAAALEQVVAGHLLLRLRVRPVGNGELAAPDLDRGGVRGRPHAAPLQVDPGPDRLLDPGGKRGLGPVVPQRGQIRVCRVDQHVTHSPSLPNTRQEPHLRGHRVRRPAGRPRAL